MLTRSSRTLLGVLAFTLLGATAGSTLAGDKVVGSGKSVEEKRPLAPFRGVSLSRGLRAEVTIGSTPSVTLSGDDNLLPLIETRVASGGDLQISWKDDVSVRSSGPIAIRVVAPKLERVDVSSGASLTAQASPGERFSAEISSGASAKITHLSAAQIDVDASSGSAVTLAGSTKRLSLDLSSGVSLRASELKAEEVTVDASSGVSVELTATKTVTGDASSGASVRVKGRPARCEVKASVGASVHCG